MNGPKRLLESEGGRLAQALKHARAQLPNDARLADIAAGLARHGAPIDASAVSTSGNGAAPASWSVAGKIGWGLGGLVALAALAVLLRERPTPPADPAAAVSGSATGVSASPMPAASVVGAAPRLTPTPRSTSQPIPPSEVAPAGSDAAATAVQGIQPPTPNTTPVVAEPALSPAPASVSGSPKANREIDPAPRVGTTLSQGSQAPASAPASNAGPAQAENEIAALKEARAALATNPSQALALTERHRSEFPRGSLTQEREIIAITALTRLGQTASAHERANRFRTAYPRSAYLKQLDRVLGRE